MQVTFFLLPFLIRISYPCVFFGTITSLASTFKSITSGKIWAFPPTAGCSRCCGLIRHGGLSLCQKEDEMQSRSDIDPSEIMKLLNWVPEYK